MASWRGMKPGMGVITVNVSFFRNMANVIVGAGGASGDLPRCNNAEPDDTRC